MRQGVGYLDAQPLETSMESISTLRRFNFLNYSDGSGRLIFLSASCSVIKKRSYWTWRWRERSITEVQCNFKTFDAISRIKFNFISHLLQKSGSQNSFFLSYQINWIWKVQLLVFLEQKETYQDKQSIFTFRDIEHKQHIWTIGCPINLAFETVITNISLSFLRICQEH